SPSRSGSEFARDPSDMTSAFVSRVSAGGLVILIGAALLLGGAQLWRGGPTAWPDVVASARIVRRTAGITLILGTLLVAAGLAAAINAPAGRHSAAIGTTVVVLGAFWGNRVLFGSMRPSHTLTNVVVLAVVLTLLWFGN